MKSKRHKIKLKSGTSISCKVKKNKVVLKVDKNILDDIKVAVEIENVGNIMDIRKGKGAGAKFTITKRF